MPSQVPQSMLTDTKHNGMKSSITWVLGGGTLGLAGFGRDTQRVARGAGANPWVKALNHRYLPNFSSPANRQSKAQASESSRFTF